MKDLIETMPAPVSALPYVRTILNESRIKAAVVHVEAGEEVELPLDATAASHLLCVTQGCATLRIGELNHVLNLEQARHLTAHETVTIWNHGSTPAKLLQVDVHAAPPAPMIVTLPRA